MERTEIVERLLDAESIGDGAGLLQSTFRPLRLRFGDVAVSLGYVRRNEVEAAFAVQRLDHVGGRPHRLLGQILVDLKMMTSAQVSQVLEVLVQETCRRSSELVGPLT